MKRGDQCSYQIEIDNFSEGEVLELDITILENVSIKAFEGIESLKVATSTDIESSDETTNYQFMGNSTLFLVVDFMSDQSRFMVEFRKHRESQEGLGDFDHWNDSEETDEILFSE